MHITIFLHVSITHPTSAYYMFNNYKNRYAHYQKAFFVWQERLFESTIKAVWEHQTAFSVASFCVRSKESCTLCFRKRTEHRGFRWKIWCGVCIITKQGGDKSPGWKGLNPPIESVIPENGTVGCNESQLSYRQIQSALLKYFVNIFYFMVSRNARLFSCHNSTKAYLIRCRRIIFSTVCRGTNVTGIHVLRFLSPPRDNVYGQNTVCT